MFSTLNKVSFNIPKFSVLTTDSPLSNIAEPLSRVTISSSPKFWYLLTFILSCAFFVDEPNNQSDPNTRGIRIARPAPTVKAPTVHKEAVANAPCTAAKEAI